MKTRPVKVSSAVGIRKKGPRIGQYGLMFADAIEDDAWYVTFPDGYTHGYYAEELELVSESEYAVSLIMGC